MMPELCSWMTETRLVKSVLHEVDKNLRAALWCDTLWSIQVSFCKLRRWRMQKWEHNIHDFLLVLSHFFFQSWCIHYSLAKSKRKGFSMHGKIVYFSTFHSVLKSLKMTQTENSDYVLLPLFCWFLLGVNCIFLPLFGGSVPMLRSSLRSQCCKLRLFELFLQFVKYILDCHDI